MNINNVLNEKFKDVLEILNFEQNYRFRTLTGIHEIGHDSARILKWLAEYDSSYYEKKNYYDLMVSILSCRNEIS